MSFEAISAISEAEERGRQMKLEAQAAARALEAEAAAEGEAAVKLAGEKAARELAALRDDADRRAKSDAEELFSETENKKAAMRAHAEARLEKAAALIVERVVNG